MIEVDFSEKFLWEFEVRNLILAMVLILVTGLTFRDPKVVGSVIAGVSLHFLLFQQLRRDGWRIASKALAGVEHGKIFKGFILRYYFRLLGVGILIGFVLGFKILDPIFLCLGLSLPLIQLFMILLELVMKKFYRIRLKEV